MTIAQAFQTLISSLELTPRQSTEASNQQTALRQNLAAQLGDVVTSRLVGSYKRGTAIRPLEDIDVFLVLGPTGRQLSLAQSPLRTLERIDRALRAIHPHHQPRIQGRSVNITFAGTEIGYDIVPAFAPNWSGADHTEPPYYEIPDRKASAWIRTNPAVHIAACIAANQRAGGMLNGLIKLAKHWNCAHDKPLRGFHIEVMSYSAFQYKPADTRVGLRDLFRHLATAVQAQCPDPAGLGAAIDADLDPSERQRATRRLQDAAQIAASAVEAEQRGDQATALTAWRKLLGHTLH